MEPMGSDFDLASVTFNIQGNELLNSRRRWLFYRILAKVVHRNCNYCRVIKVLGYLGFRV